MMSVMPKLARCLQPVRYRTAGDLLAGFCRRSKQRLEHLCEAEWDLLVAMKRITWCGAKMRRAVNIRP